MVDGEVINTNANVRNVKIFRWKETIVIIRRSSPMIVFYRCDFCVDCFCLCDWCFQQSFDFFFCEEVKLFYYFYRLAFVAYQF